MEKVYHKPTSTVCDLTDNLKQEIKDKDSVKEYAKILALPEHFSDKHLQAIVDGKMKDNDLVMVKCDEYSNNDPLGGYAVKYHKKIYLNQQNHITLFPAEQSLEEASMKYSEELNEMPEFEDVNPQFVEMIWLAGAKWVIDNKYKGE